MPPLRNVLLSVEPVWNLLDAATTILLNSPNQNWDTCLQLHGSLQILGQSASNKDLSVALFAADGNCYNKIDMFGFCTERAFHLYVPKQSKLDHLHHKWDRCVWCLQFEIHASKSQSKQPAIRNVYIQWKLSEYRWMRPRQSYHTHPVRNGIPPLSETGHLFAAGSLQVLELWTSNKDWRVALLVAD